MQIHKISILRNYSCDFYHRKYNRNAADDVTFSRNSCSRLHEKIIVSYIVFYIVFLKQLESSVNGKFFNIR